MSFRFNPRADLPPPWVHNTPATRSEFDLTTMEAKNARRRLSTLSLATKPKPKPCHDWIFSSATNVHIALDRSAFKEYEVFDSYVLTLSDDRQIYVQGIGTVELRIKRKPDSKESHTILLTDVLHVPSWLCNIFSDNFFSPGHDFEHSWTSIGVQFKKREDERLRAWGYTETFCSLDRLVLAKRNKDSRSPMLQDKDREVFSINVKWPQSQRDRWRRLLAQRGQQPLSPTPAEPSSKIIKSLIQEMIEDNDVAAGSVSRRATLSDMSINLMRHTPGKRVSSLRMTVNKRESPSSDLTY